MKYAWIIWLIGTLSTFTPVSIKYLWTNYSDSDLIIIGQSCGCPCPEARIISGELNIPNKILIEYPNINRQELTLIGNSPYEPFIYEIGLSEIYIEGEVIGVDTIMCSPTNCEFSPRFRVDNWTITSYLAVFWTWEKQYGIIYLFGVPLSFLGLSIITANQRGKKKKKVPNKSYI